MIPNVRWMSPLIGLHIVLAVIWAACGLWVVSSLAQLEAGLMGIGLMLGYTLTLRRWDDRFAATSPNLGQTHDRLVNVTLLGIAWIFLAVTVWSGAVHDYVLHLNFWSVVLNGMDPWYLERGYWGIQPPNAYGPLFNLLAGLSFVNLLAPKLLFSATYILAATVLTKWLAPRCGTSRLAFLGLLIWAWNPYAWVEVAIRGHFDVVVGAASVVAVHARRREHDFPCALALSTGVLLKYIPIVMSPFLALDHGRIRLRLIAMTGVLIGLGMGLSCLIWGPSTFRPLSFAATRSSTYLSIFRFLRGMYSPLPMLGIQADVERLALPTLALALFGAWWWCRARKVDPATASVLSVLLTLLLYRNGFPQYQIVLIMLASYWIAETWEDRRHRTALTFALVGYFGWIVAFDVVYFLIGDSSTSFEDAVGLPTFTLGIVLVACLIVSEPIRKHEASTTEAV